MLRSILFQYILAGEDDSSDLFDGKWVIEVLAFSEPLIGQVSVAVLNQRLVYRDDILLATYSLYIGFGSVKRGAIVLRDRKGVPSLAYFGVDIIGHLKVLVDSTKDLGINLG